MPTRAKSKQPSLKFTVPPGLEHGVYATIASVQPSPWDYAITFYRTVPPSGPGQRPTEVEAEAVARVVIPRNVMGNLIAALQTSMTRVAEDYSQAEEAE